MPLTATVTTVTPVTATVSAGCVDAIFAAKDAAFGAAAAMAWMLITNLLDAVYGDMPLLI